MENKLELRVGDVVRLKPVTVFETFLDGDFQIEGSDGFLKPDMVESIISRAETDAEKIARLEGELAKAPRRIEWGGGECPVPLDWKVAVYLSSGVIDCGKAKYFTWGRLQDHDNIIAYMVLPS